MSINILGSKDMKTQGKPQTCYYLCVGSLLIQGYMFSEFGKEKVLVKMNIVT